MDAHPALYGARAALALVVTLAILPAPGGAQTFPAQPGPPALTTPADATGELRDALTAQALDAPPDPAAAALLAKVAAATAAHEFVAAENMLRQLQLMPMSHAQLHLLKLRQAQLAHARGMHKRALGLLQLLAESPGLRDATYAEILRTESGVQRALGRAAESVAALVRREKLLPLPQRAEAHARILAAVDLLAPIDAILLRQISPDAGGWLALSAVLSAPPQRVVASARLWRAHYRNHAGTRLLHRRLAAAAGGERYQRIALLLPLTSPFAEAARAFADGFRAAHAADSGAFRPDINVQDIGADAAHAPLHARTAIAGGADFLVGPLGRNAINALLEIAPPVTPTLLVGNVPADKTAPNLFGISIRPEREASQAAERAFADGHRHAAIFRSNSAHSRRIAGAFALRWRVLGGELSGGATFPRGVADHSRNLRNFFGIEHSVGRARVLSAQLGVKLEFTPRRRDDIDFIFIAAPPAEARLLVPQLRFFQAHNLPLYATSQIYSGKPDAVVDADFDGVFFCDMNWMLDSALPASWRAPNAYHHTALERLYALGMESYFLIPALRALRRDPQRRHVGEAAEISVRADGNAVRHLAWARFESGAPVQWPPAAARAQ